MKMADFQWEYDGRYDGFEVRRYLGSRRYQDYSFQSGVSSTSRQSEHQGSDSEDKCSSTDTAQDRTIQRIVPSLVDLSSRVVAFNFPFAYIEHREPPVPEELQLKIISFSFPDNKETVMKFAKFSRRKVSEITVDHLSRDVTELHQIGFRLSGLVTAKHHPHTTRIDTFGYSHSKHVDEFPFVTVYFDRGKITEAYCTACDVSDVCWCDHVLAVIMARINKKNNCKVYPPVSDSLNQLSREQLLKFFQYLLTDHRKKPSILESAQALLNKLLKPHKPQNSTGTDMEQAEEDDLDSIPGAPDPTAGPGMADAAHWLLCKQSFEAQSDFKKLSLKEMGFVAGVQGHAQARPPLAWHKCKTLQGFVLDGLEPWMEDCTHTRMPFFETSTGPKELSTAYEMLKVDYGTAMAAIACWTEDVFNRETTVLPTRQNMFYSQKMLNVMAEGLENHYTPRQFSWNMSCDLAKLWRVAVLNPRLTKGNRDGMAHQLYEWAKKGFSKNVSIATKTQTTKPWPGFIVAIKLLQLDLHGPELRALCQGKTDVLPAVSSCSNEPLQCKVHYNTCENTEDSKQNEKEKNEVYCGNADLGRAEPPSKEMTEDNSPALTFESMNLSDEIDELTRLHIPRLMRCGDLLHDVNTYLAVAEALQIYGHKVSATNLACAISFALLTFYHDCVRGNSEYFAREMQSVHMSGDKEGEVKFSASFSLPNVALLYNIISSEPNTVESWWQNLKKAQQNSNEKTSLSETVSSSASFVFQVGTLGLLIPISPVASPELQGDNSHHEKWLVHQLMASRPVDSDLKFLSQCLDMMNNIPAQLTLSISLAHLLFHHSFKEASGIESPQAMTSAQQSVMEGAISVLGFSISSTSHLVAIWRKVALLAKEMLQVTATCLSLHERVIEKLTQPSGLFGEVTLRRWCVADSFHDESTKNDIAGAKHTLYALAMALEASSFCLSYPKVVNKTAETENSYHDERKKVLRKSQVALLMHTLTLPESSRFLRDKVFRDLLDVLQAKNFEENVKHLQELCRNWMETFDVDEVLQICDKLLEGEDAKSRDHAESVLTDFVKHKASAGDAETELSRVVKWFSHPAYSYPLRYRDKKSRRLSLLPGVCQQLSSLSNSGKVSFKVLSKAATSLQSYAETATKRKSNSDSSTTEEKEIVADPDSLLQTAFDLGVSSLQCVEKWWQERSGRIDECRMMTISLADVCEMVKSISKGSVSVQNRTRYLDKFLTVALATVETPTLMFLIVEQIAPMFLATGQPSSSHWRNEREYEIREACNQSYLLRELLERCRKAFDELLRGPELNQKLEQLSQEVPFNRSDGTWNETLRAFDRVMMNNGFTLKDCLRQTKRVYLALNVKGTVAFYSLFKELEVAHPILSVIAREYTSD